MARRFAVIALMSAFALLLAAPGAWAQAVNLGIKPVNQPGNFFELTLAPGEQAELEVKLGNFGTEAIAARTFAADAYTIINGGFAAKLSGEPQTGPTLWTSYEEEVLQLSPRQAVNRSFTVTVPPQTEPGEYIFGLVIQNDEPVKGSGDVALDQVNRQVIAVSINVPGPKRPELQIGDEAQHTVVADRSIVSVALENSGNVRLKPSGEMEIANSSNEIIFTRPVTMDSFYAFTDTSIEVALPQRLEPGEYRATVELADEEHGASASSAALPFTVEAGPPPGEAAITQVRDAVDRTPPWALIGGVVLLLAVLALGVMLGRRSRSS